MADNVSYKYIYQSYSNKLKNKKTLIPQHYYKIFFLST